MTEDALFYTVSMAKLCAEQGYLDKSAEIYRYLLAKAPVRPELQQELQQALAEVEARLSGQDALPAVQEAQAPDTHKRLDALIQQWIALLVEKDIKQRFDRIRAKVKQRVGQPDF